MQENVQLAEQLETVSTDSDEVSHKTKKINPIQSMNHRRNKTMSQLIDGKKISAQVKEAVKEGLTLNNRGFQLV